MKRIACFALLVCLSLIIVLTGCVTDSATTTTAVEIPQDTPKNISNDTQIVGGFTEFRELDAEDIALFEAVMTTGGDPTYTYEPIAVRTQVVAGLVYLFSVLADPQDGTDPYEVYVRIFEPLTGEPELMDITLTDGTSLLN